MLKLRETEDPILRHLHLCTICCKPLRPTDDTTTAFLVTYHTTCLTGVDMSASEEPIIEPNENN